MHRFDRHFPGKSNQTTVASSIPQRWSQACIHWQGFNGKNMQCKISRIAVYLLTISVTFCNTVCWRVSQSVSRRQASSLSGGVVVVGCHRRASSSGVVVVGCHRRASSSAVVVIGCRRRRVSSSAVVVGRCHRRVSSSDVIVGRRHRVSLSSGVVVVGRRRRRVSSSGVVVGRRCCQVSSSSGVVVVVINHHHHQIDYGCIVKKLHGHCSGTVSSTSWRPTQKSRSADCSGAGSPKLSSRVGHKTSLLLVVLFQVNQGYNQLPLELLCFGIMDGNNKVGRSHTEWTENIADWHRANIQQQSYSA